MRDVAARAPDLLASLPAGDAIAEANLRSALGVDPEDERDDASATSLDRLRAHLFEETAPTEAPQGEDVSVLSAPGESRECVEIARRVHRFARDGVPFDRISLEMLFRGLYHFTQAYAKGEATDPITYFAAPENQDLDVVKPLRKPQKILDLSPYPT